MRKKFPMILILRSWSGLPDSGNLEVYLSATKRAPAENWIPQRARQTAPNFDAFNGRDG